MAIASNELKKPKHAEIRFGYGITRYRLTNEDMKCIRETFEVAKQHSLLFSLTLHNVDVDETHLSDLIELFSHNLNHTDTAWPQKLKVTNLKIVSDNGYDDERPKALLMLTKFKLIETLNLLWDENKTTRESLLRRSPRDGLSLPPLLRSQNCNVMKGQVNEHRIFEIAFAIFSSENDSYNDAYNRAKAVANLYGEFLRSQFKKRPEDRSRLTLETSNNSVSSGGGSCSSSSGSGVKRKRENTDENSDNNVQSKKKHKP